MNKPSAAAHAARDAKSGLCVLVVEDDEADAYLICQILEQDPNVRRVVRAADGVEAHEMVVRGEVEPDLAFIDLQMPRKNGLSLLIDFSSRPEINFPMVVLTTSTAAVDAVKSRLRGALRVVSKPESIEAMKEAISAAIGAACPRSASPQVGLSQVVFGLGHNTTDVIAG